MISLEMSYNFHDVIKNIKETVRGNVMIVFKISEKIS